MNTEQIKLAIVTNAQNLATMQVIPETVTKNARSIITAIIVQTT